MAAMFPGLEKRTADVNGISIAYRATPASDLPPLLLLHGHPQTHVIWHLVAPALAKHFSLVLPDLRGYGDSSRPSADAQHINYSKREMAADNVALMRSLGHARFSVLAHDRGARVAHRMLMDHPDAVARAVLLDICPTLAMYEQTNETFARLYWHWFFLIQPAPLPETLIEADPETYLRACMSKLTGATFAPGAWAEYLRCARLPGTATGVCEDYRAAATIDLEHDRADRDAGRKVQAPLLVLWGKKGVVERCFDALREWGRVAADVAGEPVDCGHYIPEEAPEELLAKALPFLLAEQ